MENPIVGSHSDNDFLLFNPDWDASMSLRDIFYPGIAEEFSDGYEPKYFGLFLILLPPLFLFFLPFVAPLISAGLLVLAVAFAF